MKKQKSSFQKNKKTIPSSAYPNSNNRSDDGTSNLVNQMLIASVILDAVDNSSDSDFSNSSCDCGGDSGGGCGGD